jgi:hypothetical protein
MSNTGGAGLPDQHLYMTNTTHFLPMEGTILIEGWAVGLVN